MPRSFSTFNFLYSLIMSEKKKKAGVGRFSLSFSIYLSIHSPYISSLLFS
ncbi:hypothetical protein LguiA_028710 [Lonicera macranthoides]